MSWNGSGVQPLRNENTAIRRGRAAFDLAGVNDVAGEERSDPPDFDRALSRRGSIPADDPACPPTGSGGRGRRPRGGPPAVRSHPRRPDVAVPLHRPRSCNRPSPDCRRWTTPSSTSPAARDSGVRRCGSVRHRTSPSCRWRAENFRHRDESAPTYPFWPSVNTIRRDHHENRRHRRNRPNRVKVGARLDRTRS